MSAGNTRNIHLKRDGEWINRIVIELIKFKITHGGILSMYYYRQELEHRESFIHNVYELKDNLTFVAATVDGNQLDQTTKCFLIK